MQDTLIFSEHPYIRFGSNTFINVPVILQYEDIPLIEVVKVESLNFTSQISIYHSDGTYLAKAKGSRLFLTDDGKKANLTISHFADRRVCKLQNQTLFELHKTDSKLEIESELYAPDGVFIKGKSNMIPQLYRSNVEMPLQFPGFLMQNCTFVDIAVGILLKQDGSISIGTN